MAANVHRLRGVTETQTACKMHRDLVVAALAADPSKTYLTDPNAYRVVATKLRANEISDAMVYVHIDVRVPNGGWVGVGSANDATEAHKIIAARCSAGAA